MSPGVAVASHGLVQVAAALLGPEQLAVQPGSMVIDVDHLVVDDPVAPGHEEDQDAQKTTDEDTDHDQLSPEGGVPTSRSSSRNLLFRCSLRAAMLCR